MGKRELLLIVAFAIVGAVVYQATAPPADPDERGFSVSRFIELARREIGGNRAATELTTSSTEPLPDHITEVRVVGGLAELTVAGDDRTDVQTSLRVHSRAYDDAEAQQYARATVLTVDRAASSLIFKVAYPEPGSQRAFLTLKVPSRVRVRVEARPGKLHVQDVAELEVTNGSGELTVKNVAGRAAITHRGGRARLENLGSLKITARGGEATIRGIRGELSGLIERGADAKISRVGGPVQIESREARVILDELESTRGPIRVDAFDGAVTLRGIAAETRVDGVGTKIDLAMSGAAAIAIYSQGDDVTFTPPSDGYRFDAVVVNGEITPASALAALGLEASSTDDRNTRVAGIVKRGGPTVTIRNTRGNLVLRDPSAPTAPSDTSAPSAPPAPPAPLPPPSPPK